MVDKRLDILEVDDEKLSQFIFDSILTDFKLLAMNIFTWEGCPDTIEPHIIEEMLFLHGMSGFVRTKEHINAHLIICFISLLVLRIIQYKIKQTNDVTLDETKYWQEGMTAERIIKALNKWTIDKMNDEYYRFNSINDDDLSIILKAFNISIPSKLYKRAELRTIKVNIKI